jgi:hypothetical protein
MAEAICGCASSRPSEEPDGVVQAVAAVLGAQVHDLGKKQLQDVRRDGRVVAIGRTDDA